MTLRVAIEHPDGRFCNKQSPIEMMMMVIWTIVMIFWTVMMMVTKIIMIDDQVVVVVALTMTMVMRGGNG